MSRPLALALSVMCLAAALLVHQVPGQEKDLPAVKATPDELRIFELLNRERKEKDLTPLALNPTLVKMARGHSANMAKQEKMDHVLDDKNPADRAKDIGYDYMRLGENVAFGKGVTLDEIHQGWMDSKPHRENILNPDFTEVGVGIAADAKGTKWFTQVFGTPLK